jgi:hypothetical protein
MDVSCGCCSFEGHCLETLYGTYEVNLARYYSVSDVTPIRRVAAEIEICGFLKPIKNYRREIKQTFKSWYVGSVSDGSLPAEGVEINTHPANGTYYRAQVTDIMAVLAKAGGFVTAQAGCHIHVDCRDCGWKELARILVLVAFIENELFLLVPLGRRTNATCIPWTHNYISSILEVYKLEVSNGLYGSESTSLYRDVILNKLYGFTKHSKVNETKVNKYNKVRYRAVNVHSYLHRGTLELRLPPGTVYPVNIINWGRLWSAIIEYALAHSMKEIVDYTNEEHSTLDLLNIIAKEQDLLDWIIERRIWASNANTILTERT